MYVDDKKYMTHTVHVGVDNIGTKFAKELIRLIVHVHIPILIYLHIKGGAYERNTYMYVYFHLEQKYTHM